MKGLLVVEWGVLPFLPTLVDELVLPPGLACPELLTLIYFPSPGPVLVGFGAGTPAVLRERYSKALNHELSLMVATVIGTD